MNPGIIATIPLLFVVFIAIADMRDDIQLSDFTSIAILSSAYFSLLGIFLSLIFSGLYDLSDAKSRKETCLKNQSSEVRASIGAVLFFAFFGILFLQELPDVHKETEKFAAIFTGLVITIVSYKYSSKVMRIFRVKKIYSGIRLRDIGKYIAWYHFPILLLDVFAVSILFS